MDQIKYQKIASCVTESIKSHQNVFKITQVLVSLSLCSFILFSSPSSSFLHYFKFYLSTFPFQLFTHNIDKNSMFLLCNGLLVFVGITRSFSGSRDHDDQDSIKYGEEVEEEEEEVMMMEEKTVIEEHNIIVAEDDEVLEIKQYDEEQEEEEAEDDDNIVEQIIVVDEEHHHDHDHDHEQVEEEKKLHEEEENNELFDDAEQEDEENVSESDDQFLSEGNFEEEEEEEEESNMLSTEELNKKFEDFIRRMKQDLRIEAQRQLVMV
ncbi:hypothetical protein HN51_023658 [Arachis hypogaea]|uniref:DUF4408 domain-containing protein n=1 Tax=Arachis hypogaea TaxID=3818 RepID=A0A445C312_ARAHY|nr:uncharacterized protein DS421_7g200650 [Arachis hypogaea]RYR45324.1 hypothetical protein Ahy_A07g031166 [Arachis hypogaea]